MVGLDVSSFPSWVDLVEFVEVAQRILLAFGVSLSIVKRVHLVNGGQGKSRKGKWKKNITAEEGEGKGTARKGSGI